MKAPSILSELEHLRLAICDNTQKIENIPFLRALCQLQEAWFAQAGRPQRAPDPPSPASQTTKFLTVCALAWSYLGG